MTEFITDEMRLANQALVLRNHGHVNVDKLISIYEIERLYEATSAYVEYINFDGDLRTDPIDLTLQQVILEASELELEQQESAAVAWGLTDS